LFVVSCSAGAPAPLNSSFALLSLLTVSFAAMPALDTISKHMRMSPFVGRHTHASGTTGTTTGTGGAVQIGPVAEGRVDTRSVWSTARSLVAVGGVRALYRGWFVSALKAVPLGGGAVAALYALHAASAHAVRDRLTRRLPLDELIPQWHSEMAAEQAAEMAKERERERERERQREIRLQQIAAAAAAGVSAAHGTG
jgi:hypothetical protein